MAVPSLSELGTAERHYEEALRLKASRSKHSLADLDAELSSTLGSADDDGLTSKALLRKVLDWKLARGKFRPTLPKLVDSNDAKTVERCVREALEKIRACQSTEDALASGAVQKLAELKGVGPATASGPSSSSAPLIQAVTSLCSLLVVSPASSPPLLLRRSGRLLPLAPAPQVHHRSVQDFRRPHVLNARRATERLGHAPARTGDVRRRRSPARRSRGPRRGNDLRHSKATVAEGGARHVAEKEAQDGLSEAGAMH